MVRGRDLFSCTIWRASSAWLDSCLRWSIYDHNLSFPSHRAQHLVERAIPMTQCSPSTACFLSSLPRILCRPLRTQSRANYLYLKLSPKTCSLAPRRRRGPTHSMISPSEGWIPNYAGTDAMAADEAADITCCTSSQVWRERRALNMHCSGRNGVTRQLVDEVVRVDVYLRCLQTAVFP